MRRLGTSLLCVSRKDYAFRRHCAEKLNIVPGCPELRVSQYVHDKAIAPLVDQITGLNWTRDVCLYNAVMTKVV